MNLGQMTTEVALTLNNLKSSHPWYSKIQGSSTLSGYIVRAANKLIRMTVGGNGQNADLFPELDNSWTVGPTSAGVNVIAKPTDCIVVQSITRAESASAPDWAQTQEQPLAEPISALDFGLLSKASTSNYGYAKIWARKGKSILIHPTPTSTYLDYLRFYGLKSEIAIYNSTDVLFLDEQWHDLVVTLTCNLIALRMGWKDEAAMWMADVQQQLGQTMNVTAEQNETFALSVTDAPSRFSVYG